MARVPRSAVVVGAGVAGLTAAIDLACRGVAVTLLERAAAPGGKMRQVAVGDVQLDAGPTVLTLRHVFDELFDAAGAALDDYVRLEPADVLARHAWAANERLDLHADVPRSTAAIGELAGAAEARRFTRFCAEASDIYRTLEQPFLRAQRPTTLGLTRAVGLRHLAALWRIRPFTTLWRALGRHFRDPRLRQLFGRYATYCGSSPFAAPATLMLVAHVEQRGVWRVQGGMHALARALERLARERGVTLRYRAEVQSIRRDGGHTSGVELADGERIDAEAVIFNGDAAALASGRLGAAAAQAVDGTPAAARSLSAVTWCLAARTRGFALEHHNVFFSRDYVREFAELGAGRLPSEPTVYVCAQDRPATLPTERERLLCLVNAPARGDGPADAGLAACEFAAFARLAACGLDVQWDEADVRRTTPQDFERLFPATGGALYGRASHGWRASFERPAARTRLPGLVLAGGSVHPGPGVPMAALSGRLAAAAVVGA